MPLRLNEIIHVHECYFLEFITCITAQSNILAKAEMLLALCLREENKIKKAALFARI